MKKQYLIITILIVLVLGGAFYWFEYRPSQIRQECIKKAKASQGNVSFRETLEGHYSDCLRSKGLAK